LYVCFCMYVFVCVNVYVCASFCLNMTIIDPRGNGNIKPFFCLWCSSVQPLRIACSVLSFVMNAVTLFTSVPCSRSFSDNNFVKMLLLTSIHSKKPQKKPPNHSIFDEHAYFETYPVYMHNPYRFSTSHDCNDWSDVWTNQSYTIAGYKTQHSFSIYHVWLD
jgi:hypothetical protein